MTHDVCADFESAADVKSMKSRELTRKIFQTTERSVAFMTESFCNSGRNLRS